MQRISSFHSDLYLYTFGLNGQFATGCLSIGRQKSDLKRIAQRERQDQPDLTRKEFSPEIMSLVSQAN